MSLPLFHLHKRKRIHQKKEKYPHPQPHKRMVDKLVYAVGIVAPFLTAEQSYKIHASQTAEGVSLFAYAGFVCVNIIWLWYGIIHKEMPIILMYTLLGIFNTSVVIGVLMYG
jgi:uncharacterized protein with PQ loop repeat